MPRAPSGSMKPRSSERSISARICSDSNSSISWFCVNCLSQSFRCLVVRPVTISTQCKPIFLSFPGDRTLSKCHELRKRVRLLLIFRGELLSGLIAHENEGRDGCHIIRRFGGAMVRGLSVSCARVLGRLEGPRGTPRGQKLERPLGRQRLDLVAAAQARIRLAVGHVRPETAVLDHDRLAARRIGAELAQRRLRCTLPAAAAHLRLREELESLSRVSVNSCSSPSSERVSVPIFTNGP